MTCGVCGLETPGPHASPADCIAALRGQLARLQFLAYLLQRALDSPPDY
jgi:hypothetical protein